MASRRYRSKNSLNSNISRINAQVSQSNKRPAPKRLAANVVTSVAVQNAAIVTESIADASITTKKIAVGAITSDLIAPGAVTVNLSSTTQTTGTLAVTSGGTGATSLAAGYVKSSGTGALTSSAIAAADVPALDAAKITTGTFGAALLPTIAVNKGGTGATDAATARTNLGAAATTHTHNTGDINSFDADVVTVVQTLAFGGNITITPSAANTPTSGSVSFAGLNLVGAPWMVATAYTTVPGTTVTGVGVSAVNSAGALIYLTRTNTTDTVVNWVALNSAYLTA